MKKSVAHGWLSSVQSGFSLDNFGIAGEAKRIAAMRAACATPR
jgi:hypothetical protein